MWGPLFWGVSNYRVSETHPKTRTPTSLWEIPGFYQRKSGHMPFFTQNDRFYAGKSLGFPIVPAPAEQLGSFQQ